MFVRQNFISIRFLAEIERVQGRCDVRNDDKYFSLSTSYSHMLTNSTENSTIKTQLVLIITYLLESKNKIGLKQWHTEWN